MNRFADTRESLLARLAEPDDQAAWSEFVATYEQVILRYSRSHGLQEADAREVVQEVLLVVHRKIADWKPSGRPGGFRLWLLRIAHRMSLRALRERARTDRSVGGTSVDRRLNTVPAPCSEDETQAEWQRFAFCWAASQVQREVLPATWQAFWLSAVEGLSPTAST